MTGGRPARIVLDANTLVSAVIGGTRFPPAPIRRAVDAAFGGASTVIACPLLLDEVQAVLGRPKLRAYIGEDEIASVMTWILSGSRVVGDPVVRQRICRDPGDDYLVALAREHRATLVTGDLDLLDLRDVVQVPIITARAYLGTLL